MEKLNLYFYQLMYEYHLEMCDSYSHKSAFTRSKIREQKYDYKYSKHYDKKEEYLKKYNDLLEEKDNE